MSEESELRAALFDESAIRSIAGSDKKLFNELMVALKDEERRRFLHYHPYVKQLEFHNSMATERILSGANQEISVKNKVLTLNGWKNAGDISIKDILFDGNGHQTTIDRIDYWKDSEFYRMVFSDGSHLDCGINHLWSAKIGARHRYNSDRGFETFDMRTILKRCGIGKIPSYKRLVIPAVNNVDFPKKDLPINPYLLGHYIGNGWIADGYIRLSGTVDYYNLIKSIYECGPYYENTQTFRVLEYRGREFEKLGFKNGALNKFIPDLYKFSSQKQRKELFMGLMDSDGCCDKDGRVSYYTSSKQLCLDVLELGRSLGLQWSMHQRITRNTFGRGKDFVGYYCRGRSPWFNPFKLERRKFNWNGECDCLGQKLLVEIIPLGKMDGVCFHVKSALHTYICQDYIVTHNSGKTISGTMETCFHLTGNYPEWWTGRRVKPRLNASNGEYELNAWVIGTDSKTVRDSLQAKIIGTANRDFNDGCIHPDYIEKQNKLMARGVPDAVDTIYIKHKSGCRAKLQFRSYEQGRENLQAATIDFVYCDEEPPAEVMGELRARIAATGGFLYMAFTPLKGMTPLVQEFWMHDNPEKFLVCMNIYEAKHFTEDKLKKIESLYSGLSEAERKARMMGVPTMGAGLVYPIDDNELYYDGGSEIPRRWKRIGALDFGRGEHPQAMVWGALDPISDTLYIYDAIKTVNKTVAENASIIKRHGDWIPMAWPHDLNRESGVGDAKKTEGYKYKELYVKEGVKLTPEFAKTKDGSNKVEVGIIEMRQRMLDGRFKVARHLSEWFKEKQIYRYGDDNKPIKEKDDLLDATRYLTIMLRYAISEEENTFNSIGLLGNGANRVLDNTPIY